jgi:hypothetical protein
MERICQACGQQWHEQQPDDARFVTCPPCRSPSNPEDERITARRLRDLFRSIYGELGLSPRRVDPGIMESF